MRLVFLGAIAVAVIFGSAAPLQAEPSLRLRPDRDTTDETSAPDRSRNAVSHPEEFRYRLIVPGSSDSLLRRVRQVVPDAFRATVDGERVIQAGLFVEAQEAESVQRRLARLNLNAEILSIDRSSLLANRTQPDRTQPDRTQPDRVGTDRTRSSRTNPVRSGSRNFQYRLVVQGSSDNLLRQVRQVVPDAFRIVLDGDQVIQAGLFEDRTEAEAIQQQLRRIDTPSRVFDIHEGNITAVTRPSTTARLPIPARLNGRVVVVVDPGHGGADPGAVGIGGIHEADIVLDIASEVAAQLNEAGLQAVLTRQDDREIDLEPRVSLAESLNADLFVSIHANAISLSRPDVNGIETYYYDSGSALAASIHNSLVNATGMNDRGTRQARFYVLTRTSMPAVLVEVGFVTGQEDVVKLRDSNARRQIANGIVQGILRYVQ
ncbi:MAG: N-acetylmuramoyl-L-alanine amidase [Elainella sp. Prado103]|jgi:N-acetylmuramoyl-L-alanine amidase|nr:N-acetylmuramoyl-L-alanine amidase [Elainella sp. Prado103]